MNEYQKQLGRVVAKVIGLNPLLLGELELVIERLEKERGESKVPHQIAGPAQIAGPYPIADPTETHPPSIETQPPSKDWPHAPIHRLGGKGTFIVTAGTLEKEHFFRDLDSLDFLEAELLRKAKQYDWQLEAWAVFSNHYHFVGHALTDAGSLREFMRDLHRATAHFVNLRDDQSGRKVWHNYWETELTYPKAYQARLKYVHYNAVKHKLVAMASQYRWCSAAWFERVATQSQVKTIYSFKTDKVNVFDEFEPLAVPCG